MRSFAVLALAGAVAALPQPQAVTSAIAPQETAPSGCTANYDGEFQIAVVNVSSSSKRSLEARADKALTITLKNGVLTDDENRTGYIASNNQFQFDGPVQAGAVYTAGWTVCANNTLALGNSAIFYQCLSGTFYNLYDESTGAQCSPIYIDVIAASGSSASGVATQIADGQVTASAVASPVSQISDGQIQATTATPQVISQISDGQIQATTGTAAVVTQIGDGQIQATTGTAAVVTQISDGQIQATTGAAVVTQISDGQIQATTGAAVVTQISDGQIQAATATGKIVSQISDGQIQAAATNGTTPTLAAATPSVSVFTGSANTIKAGVFGVAAGALAMAML